MLRRSAMPGVRFLTQRFSDKNLISLRFNWSAMYTATIHINLDSDNALSDLKTARDGSFFVHQFEIVDDEYIKFVMDAGEHRDDVVEILNQKDAIQSLEYISDSQLLVTKRSSGVLPIIRNNHGMFQKMNQFEGTHRTFDIVLFDRESLKAIVEGLQELGTVQVERLRPFTGSSSLLSSRQAEALELAYEAGYYDWPRRTDAETLADQLGVGHTTFLEHLRKAEEKIIGEVLGGAALTPEVISHHN